MRSRGATRSPAASSWSAALSDNSTEPQTRPAPREGDCPAASHSAPRMPRVPIAPSPTSAERAPSEHTCRTPGSFLAPIVEPPDHPHPGLELLDRLPHGDVCVLGAAATLEVGRHRALAVGCAFGAADLEARVFEDLAIEGRNLCSRRGDLIGERERPRLARLVPLRAGPKLIRAGHARKGERGFRRSRARGFRRWFGLGLDRLGRRNVSC